MSNYYQASYECLYNFSDHFLLTDEAEISSFTTVSSSLSALSLHLIFRSAAHLISLSDQSLASSSAVSLFALLMLSVSPAALRAYNHLLPAHTISDQVYVNMSRFSINDSRTVMHFCNLIINER
ncbi:hypothetical protein BDDG_12887 [Blastomyces dermatitidis ATCC 18188]|uniref:Uncharacterized protein n=1 Tax=Ajellomyces dermatitidis (strain ATCC 18188 / CBS 674.68) TaxID=653446 RepID=A0A0J9ER85_AJEDA|nr:hypothetical protein BDDG_12887 [Blastomyces dermatitidis ATCC 18188]